VPAVPDISVVVPTYRRPELLAKCLASLAAQDLERSRFEVVVVDDGSGPETERVLEAAAEGWPEMRWMALPSNRGPASARNRAIAEARGNYLLFVDDDIVAPPNLIRTHLELHEHEDDQLGVVGLVQWHPDLLPTPFMRWLDTTDAQFSYGTGMREGPIEQPWDAFYTCNLSLARRVMLDVGGFDERFPYPAYEDAEVAARLAERGFHLEYRPGALAWHARAITLDQFCARMRFVGESAVLLKTAQPDVPFKVSLDSSGPRGWRRPVKRILSPISSVVPMRSIQAFHFRTEVDRAYRQGLLTGQRQVGNPNGRAAV
jgi:GT2 family glycosyltransferase